MGKLRACLVFSLAACGSDHAKVDAGITLQDSPAPDAKEFLDAPPPQFDLSCFGMTPPTTAADPITISGTTQTVSQGGASPVAAVPVQTFEVGNNTAVDTVVSDTSGNFTTGAIDTGGMPFDGYLRAAMATYRTTYLYPPNPLVANLAGVPVALVTTQNFGLVEMLAGADQNDADNGAMLIVVADCEQTPIAGATLSVKQANMEVGEKFDLGALAPQAAGTYFVFNVPDGETQLSAMFDGKTFPTRTVRAYKAPSGQSAVGTITATAVTPGP